MRRVVESISLLIVAGQPNSAVDRFQDVRPDQLSPAQDADTGSVTVQYISMLRQLRELDFGHVHQRVHLVLGPLEVLDAKGVDRDYFHTGSIADLENLGGQHNA